jgi:hypothetical protein
VAARTVAFTTDSTCDVFSPWYGGAKLSVAGQPARFPIRLRQLPDTEGHFPLARPLPAPRHRPYLIQGVIMHTLSRNLIIAFTVPLLVSSCGGGGGSGTTPAPAGTTPTNTPGPTSQALPDVHCTSTGATGLDTPSTITDSITSTPNVIELQNSTNGGYINAHSVAGGGTLSVQPFVLDNTGACKSIADAAESLAGTLASLNGGAISGRVFVYIENKTPNLPTMAQVCFLSSPGQCDATTVMVAGTVKDEKGAGVKGLTAAATNNGTKYTSVTDANGNYALKIPGSSTLPTHFSIDIYDTAGLYNPSAISFSQSGSTNRFDGNATVNSIAGTPTLLSIELVPDVHHIGDSNYAGAANSEFQYPNAEGTSYSRTFTVSATQKTYTGATLRFLAKGVECKDEILINQKSLGTLDPSDPNGNYTQYSVAFNPSVLVQGANNTIQIVSRSCSSSDLDDFEFNNVQIVFK